LTKAAASSRIIAAAFSAIMIAGAFLLPVVTVGITDASTTGNRDIAIDRLDFRERRIATFDLRMLHVALRPCICSRS